MRKNHLLAFVLSLIITANISGQVYKGDTLACLLHDEAQYYLDKLKDKETPAYFISFRVIDNKTLKLTSDMGVISVVESHKRELSPLVRVGTPETDNYTYTIENRIWTKPLPLYCDAVPVIKEVIWKSISERYDKAVNKYEEIITSQKTKKSELDTIPAFSESPVEIYYEKPLTEKETRIDKNKFKKYLKNAGSVFKEYKDLTSGKATLEYSIIRTTIVNSEGTVVAQNRKAFRLTWEASAIAEDGTNCNIFEDAFAYDESGLPDAKELETRIRKLSERVIALSKAPIAEAYTGPAIISGHAAGVFFHEVLGHRLEAVRMKSINDNLSEFIGKRIMPESMSMYMDPTIRVYNGHDLNGFYLYDDEGTKAKRVACIKNGYLQQYITSRTPDGRFMTTNGHGRADAGHAPIARQSNLIFETTVSYTDEQLREMLIESLKKQNKEYGYLFRTAKGGYTVMGSSKSTNIFNVTPVEVYRVFADGREDQLVRGVKLIGTPLSVFSNIVAAGGESELFTGYCGAASGNIPISASSPSIFISQIETQSEKPGSTSTEEPFDSPDSTEISNIPTDIDEDTIIFRAMADEMAHIRRELIQRKDTNLLFIDYLLERTHESSVTSSRGACISINNNNIKNMLRTDIILGDSMCTGKNKDNFKRGINIPDEIDYTNLRENLRNESSKQYIWALNELNSKKLKKEQDSSQDEEQQLPEFKSMPAAEWIGPSGLKNICPIQTMIEKANRLSTVFSEYPELFDHSVYIKQICRNHYRLTSEGQKIMMPDTIFHVGGRVNIKTKDGRLLTKYYGINVGNIDDLPFEEKIADELREFAEYTIRCAQTSPVEDLYVGPILYEGNEAREALSNIILDHTHLFRYSPSSYERNKYLYLGKQIFPRILNVHQINDSVYNGKKLRAYRKVDANGTPSMTLPIIEKGVLKNMLTSREPYNGCPSSTGNEMFYSTSNSFGTGYSPCMFRVTSEKTVSYKKLYRRFLDLAKESGLEYAYIIRGNRTAPDELIRINTTTGEKETVRGRYFSPSREQLKNISVTTKEENIFDADHTTIGNNAKGWIVPKAFIVEDMELNITAPNDSKVDEFFYGLKQ